MRPILKWLLGALAIAMLGAFLFPVYSNCGSASPSTAGLSRTKQVALALLIYQSDFDDVYPPCDTWVDAVYPYVKSLDYFTYPAGREKKTSLSPAMNGLLDRKPQPSEAESKELVTLFQVIGPARNAWGGPSGAWSGYDNNHRVAVAFADSHARLTPRPQLITLKWKP